MTNFDHHRARVVGNTLRHPYHKSLARFMAKSYLGDYRGPNGWVKRLRQLAKTGFSDGSVHTPEGSTSSFQVSLTMS